MRFPVVYQKEYVVLPDKEIYLDSRHKKLGGVCAGVANYLDVSRFWVRIAAVIGLLIHPPSVLLAYGLAYFILDEEPESEWDYRRDLEEEIGT